MWKRAKAMALQLEGMKKNMRACICSASRDRMEGSGVVKVMVHTHKFRLLNTKNSFEVKWMNYNSLFGTLKYIFLNKQSLALAYKVEQN